MKQWIFNPFRYIAGAKSLAIGVLLMLALSVLCYFSDTYFSGALSAQYLTRNYMGMPYILHICYLFSGWVILSVIAYFAARLMSKTPTRFIDMAGTLALSKAPLLFFALMGFIPSIHIDIDMNANMEQMMDGINSVIVPILPLLFVSLVFVIWYIALMYNAYSTCSNLKGGKAVLSFIAVLIVAEVLVYILGRNVISNLL